MTEFEADSLRWRGRLLTGQYAHACNDWDGLPIDETCAEWPCACAGDVEKALAAGCGSGRTALEVQPAPTPGHD